MRRLGVLLGTVVVLALLAGCGSSSSDRAASGGGACAKAYAALTTGDPATLEAIGKACGSNSKSFKVASRAVAVEEQLEEELRLERALWKPAG